MSKERELLERVMYRIPSAVISEHDLDLVDDIKELLAQHEQEPSSDDYMYNKLKEDYEYLLNQMEQTREPLSDEEVIAKYKDITLDNPLYTPSYYAGFRDAEKAHGITGVDDE